MAYHTQLLGSGTPLQSKFTQSYQESEKSSQQFGIPKLFGAQLTGEDVGQSSSERTYDQSWPMLIQTVEELLARGYICDGALGVPVSSLIRLRGVMQLVDLRILRDLWNPLSKMLKQHQKGGGKQVQGALPDMGSLAEIAKFVPHPLVVQLVTSDKPDGQPFSVGESSLNAWGLLDKENLIGTADSFAIMNGGIVPGEYWMIAVLDVGSTTELPQIDFSTLTSGNTFEFALYMQQMIRTMFGRPHYANGVTPLMIYRRLAGAKVNFGTEDAP